MDSGHLSGRRFRTEVEPSVHDRICGVHFVSGRPSKDESAIDYVPTIFRDAKKRGNAEPNIEAKSFVDCGIRVSDSIWEEIGRLRDEVATLKATVCDLKRQLQDREIQTRSYSLYRTMIRRQSFILVCHPLLFSWHFLLS